LRRLHLDPGEFAYRSGDTGQEVYLVRSGGIELVTIYPETGEGVDGRHGPGHVFGEVELIDGRARSHSAKANQPTELLVFSREELMDLLFDHPERSLVLGRSVFNRLRDLYTNETLESDLARLREEMQASIRQAVVAHEGRVVRSHNGMAAIAVPIVLMVLLAIGSYWYFHRV
jgi:CRP-like cAMP-binding protein